MKKILYILFVLVFMSSCATKTLDETSPNGCPIIKYTEIISNDGFIMNANGHIHTVKKFEFEGHTYIEFDINGSYGGNAGVEHDPECLKKDIEKWTNK